MDKAQRIIDQLRRSYTPFWYGETAARVPTQVTLVPSKSENPSKPPLRESAQNQVLLSPNPDARVFDHWAEMIDPLKLLSNGIGWRDPSDERIPLSYFMEIAPDLAPSEPACRDALLQISDGD